MNGTRRLAPLLALTLGSTLHSACVTSADPTLAVLETPRVDEHSAVLRWDVPGAASMLKPVIRQLTDLQLHRVTDEGPKQVEGIVVETAPGLCVLSRLPEGKYEAKLTLTSASDATKTSLPKSTQFIVKPAPIPVQLDAITHFELAAEIGIANALVVSVGEGNGAKRAGQSAIHERAEWLLREYVRATIGPSSRHSLASIEESRQRTEKVGYQLDAVDPILVVVQLDALDATDGTCQLALKIFDLALTKKTLDNYTSWLDRPLVYSDVVEIDPGVSKGDPSTSLALFEGWKALVTNLVHSPRWNAYHEKVRNSADGKTPAYFDDARQQDLVHLLQLRCDSATPLRGEACFFRDRLDVELPPPLKDDAKKTLSEKPPPDEAVDEESKTKTEPAVEGQTGGGIGGGS